MNARAGWMAALFLATVLGGCLSDDGNGGVNSAFGDGITTPAERELLDFVVTDARSHTLEAGTYEIAEPLSLFVDVELPITEGGQAANPVDGPKVHLGLFLPVIEGCNWEEDNLPEQCRVPIIADIGPYYSTPGDQFSENGVPLFGEGDVPAAERGSGRLGEFLISRYVPHGYGVAQVSVFGSGLSNHCFDVFGLGEQLGAKGAVDFLGETYSNGNVGLIGRSYDGSTPWMVASHGSEYLKTIVPISGLSGLQDLVIWNGATESRAVSFQNVVYGRFGFDANEIATDSANQATCGDWTTAGAWGAAGYAEGADNSAPEGTFWAERAFVPGALENYDGSVYMIHGLQDDNVDPHAGWMGELALREKGLDVRSMWGQWYHNYPDRISEHGVSVNDETGEVTTIGVQESIRMDWAQDLLEWFNFYLMEEGGQPLLHAEIQQLDGAWRIEESWPPVDANMLDVALGTGTIQVFPEDAPDGIGPTELEHGQASANMLDLGVLSETDDVLMGGFSTVTLMVTPGGPGGQIYVELRDGTVGGDFGLSYGIMDLRHATGSFEQVTPGLPMEITIPLQNFDAVLPAGHSLEMIVHGVGNGYLSSSVPNPVVVNLEVSTLHLSTLERGPEVYYMPPVWWTTDAEGNVVQKSA